MNCRYFYYSKLRDDEIREYESKDCKISVLLFDRYTFVVIFSKDLFDRLSRLSNHKKFVWSFIDSVML